MAGHVSKRRKGGKTKWRARYPDPCRPGRKEIERIFDRKLDAERWLNEQKVAVQRGTHIDPTQATRLFREVVDAWRSTWVELEPKTKAGYDNMLSKHVVPRWGDVRIGAVSADAVQDWVNELAASGRSPSTIAHIYGVARSVLKLAVERRYITVNPCNAVRLPRRSTYGEKGERREMLVLTAQEVALVAEAIDPHYRVLIYTAAYSGLRAGELGALRRRDIDLFHHSLNVRRGLKEVNTTAGTLNDNDKGLIFGPTKTGKIRNVGIPGFLVRMLTEHLETIPPNPDALVFTAPEGGPLRHSNFYRRHFKPTVERRFCESCGEQVRKDARGCPDCGTKALVFLLPAEKHGLRFHDLRHTCATLLIDGGAPALAIRDHLGHRDIQTTMNVYGHLYPSMQAALADTLDAAYATTAASAPPTEFASSLPDRNSGDGSSSSLAQMPNSRRTQDVSKVRGRPYAKRGGPSD